MQTNEEIFRIIIEDGFSKGDVSVFDNYASVNFVEHQSSIKPPNAEGAKKAIDSLHKAFPDFSLVIEDIIVNNDKEWGRMTWRGTHQNQFGLLPPSGKKIEITIIDIMRFKDGKMVEHWGVPDRMALMEQLGMKPKPWFI